MLHPSTLPLPLMRVHQLYISNLKRAHAGFTSCIIAAPSVDPISLMQEVLPLLQPSTQFVVYSQWIQPLAECLNYLMVRSGLYCPSFTAERDGDDLWESSRDGLAAFLVLVSPVDLPCPGALTAPSCPLARTTYHLPPACRPPTRQCCCSCRRAGAGRTRCVSIDL